MIFIFQNNFDSQAIEINKREDISKELSFIDKVEENEFRASPLNFKKWNILSFINQKFSL